MQLTGWRVSELRAVKEMKYKSSVQISIEIMAQMVSVNNTTFKLILSHALDVVEVIIETVCHIILSAILLYINGRYDCVSTAVSPLPVFN